MTLCSHISLVSVDPSRCWNAKPLGSMVDFGNTGNHSLKKVI